MLKLLNFSCSRCLFPSDHSDHFLVNINTMTDEQLRDALLRGLREVERGEGTEASVAFSQMREELSGA